MFHRTKHCIICLDRYWRLPGLLTIALSMPLSAIANSGDIASAPVPVKFDYVPERTLSPDRNFHSLGDRGDHLPLYTPKANRIVLRLGERRVYVYDDDQVLESYPVAIGSPNTPTPTGQFEVFQMIVDPVWQSPWTGEVFAPGANSALGLRWIGFAELPNGIIGFHGTPTVSSIGQAASNGCVRLANDDVLALYEHVRLGMTVIVEP
jgi:lipoprotein-anchoring transpeptidase ErfK/SrfK